MTKKRSKPRVLWVVFGKSMDVDKALSYDSRKEAEKEATFWDAATPSAAPHQVVKYVREVKRRNT